MRHPSLVAMGLLCLCAGLLAAPIGDVQRLYDWSDLPVLDGGRLQEASNWRGANAGKLVDAAPGQCVLLETDGPGCIERLSINSIQGRLKVFCDGAAAPQLDIPLEQLYPDWQRWNTAKNANLDANYPQTFPFLIPFTLRAPGMKNACYLPIAYAKSVKVVWEHDPGRPWGYFTVLYRRYPANTPVTTFSLDALKRQETAVRAAANAWRKMGEMPHRLPTDQVKTGTLTLGAKAATEIYTAPGAGTVIGLRLRAKPWHVAIDRLLVLRAYWDGEARPSVETPIGLLCGSIGGARQSLVLPVGGGDKDGWYWCYLPMPYANGARLTLENLSGHQIPELEYELTVRPGQPANGAGRFCARWKRDRQVGEEKVYTLLQATGAGKLVGYNLDIRGCPLAEKYSARKSRMLLYRDGEAEASIADTALMQYYYGGWYGGPNWDTPLSAIPIMDFATRGTYGDYRYFLTDAPDWTTGARLVFDASKDELAGMDYSSVVYWYRAPAGRDTLPPVTHDALLLAPREPNVYEAEALVKTATITGGDLLVVDDRDERYLVSGNAFISFAPLGYRESITFRVPVETAGNYLLRIRPIFGPSGGLWDVSVNGSAIPGPKDNAHFNTQTYETGFQLAYTGGWMKMGTFPFTAGENTITFVSHPGYAGLIQRGILLGLDAMQLEPVK
ncbi:MAG: hypothetical protein BWY76_00633 [bacterium ADurb.Bin429]|nr:MAG: hypothetical protein BWY76_00633 [bacterium ADurb.Bin429]